MKCSLLFALVLFSATVFGQVNQKLQGNRWAYYGEEFYKGLAAKNLSKEFVNAVLTSNHVSSAGKFDLFGNCNTATCYSHQSIGYDGARQVLFGEIQLEQAGNRMFVTDVYCGKKFFFTDLGNVGNMHTEVNIEHTWPQSRFSSKYAKGVQKADMHHLYLTDSDANNRRGNFWFGEIGNAHNELGVDACEISGLFQGGGAYLFTPPVGHKGNLARSLFYFAIRYDMEIDAKMEAVLRKWHTADPVDAAEVRRHEIVSGHQNIRNPFVDHPETVDAISNF